MEKKLLEVRTSIPGFDAIGRDHDKEIMKIVIPLARLDTAIKFIEEGYKVTGTDPLTHEAYRYLMWVKTGERKWFTTEADYGDD